MTYREKIIKELRFQLNSKEVKEHHDPVQLSVSDAEKILALMKDFDTQIQYRDDHIAMYQAEIKRLEAMLKEQEAKHGEWIDIWREDDPDTSSHARCSVCNRISTRPVGAYCKWCGAKMDDEVESR